jgi:predicted ATPase
VPTDRLTRVRVRGLRTLDDLTLDLNGLSVLIGDNGSGKSSIIECLELLRRIGSGPNLLQELSGIHGGVPQLLRFGAQRLAFDVSAKGNEGDLEYSLTLVRTGDFLAIERESLDVGPMTGHKEPLPVIQRGPGFARVFDQTRRKVVDGEVAADKTLLGSFGVLPPQVAISRMSDLLAKIRVHVPFETTPSWVSNDARRNRSPMRSSITVQPSEGVTRLGGNLANAWMGLRNEHDEAHWRATMEYVRLGLGPDIESVNVRPDPGGGNIGLQVKYRGLQDQVPSYSLSDGTLAYLAFVAIFRSQKGETLIAFDEPETHLHPLLLARVVEMFEELAEECPVVLATHSDRLLDSLSDPAHSALLCELDTRRATKLVKPNPAELEAWLERFRGLGQVRSEGYESQVFRSRPS